MSGRSTRSAARLAGVATVLLLVVVSAASAADPGGGYRKRAHRLQVQAQALDTKAHQALLGLYALDTRLSSARSAVAALEARARRLRTEQRRLTQQLAAARRTLAVSRADLAQHLRNLYEQGNIDPLAVMLGAQSLSDAVSKLDGLSRVADFNRRVVDATSAAGDRLVHVRSELAARQLALGRSLAAARQSARDLASARSERLAFVESLRREKALKTNEIAALQAAAVRIERKSAQIQASANAASEGEASSAGSADPAQASSPGDRTLRVSATGYSLPGHTATGLPVGWGIVAVDPTVIPLGTRLSVPGYGEAVAADVGSAVKGATIDLWFPTLAQALSWGRRWVTITIH